MSELPAVVSIVAATGGAARVGLRLLWLRLQPRLLSLGCPGRCSAGGGSARSLGGFVSSLSSSVFCQGAAPEANVM